MGDRMAEVPKTPKVAGGGSARDKAAAKKGRAPAGAAYDTYVQRQTKVESTGNRYGNGSAFDGPNRLHGAAQGRAIAAAKKASWPRTQRAMEEFLSSEDNDTTRLLPFRPTKTIGPRSKPPRRPRTKAAGYDSRSKTVRILFAYKESWDSLDGAIYEYYNVPYNVWRMVKRNASTGQTINRTLDNYQYAVLREAPR